MALLRRARTFFLAALVLMTVAATALVVLARIYEDEVKAGLQQALNAHLNAPVSVGPMDLTLLRRFPLASLHLQQVLAMEVAPDKAVPDTLLYAEDLFLEFNLWDLFQGDYTVRSVHGDHVLVQPAILGNGAHNYAIWRSDSSSTNSGFALQRVTVNELRLRYRDERTATEIAGTSPKLTLTGRFRPEGDQVGMSGELALKHWRIGELTHLGERTARVRLDMSFGGADGAFRITQAELMVGDVPVNITMALVPIDGRDELDLRANGFGLDLQAMLDLLPDGVRSALAPYQLKGTADVALRYAGPLAAGPSLSMGMDVHDGRLKERTSGVALSGVQGGLALELAPDGALRKVVVKGLTGKAAGGSFFCTGELDGARNTAVKAHIKGSIGLADLVRFARLDTLEQASGRLRAEVRVEGRLKDLARVRPADLKALRISGTADLRDASLKLKGLRHRVTGLDAELALDGADATVRSLKAGVQGSQVELSGTLHNLMPYLFFTDQPLLIAAKGSSPRIDLAALLGESGTPANGATPTYELVLPALIALDIEADIGELVFEEFTAWQLHGRVRMKERTFVVDPLRFHTASGTVLAVLELDGRGSGPFPLRIEATAKDIAIDELFREFGDFGQTFLTHEHLSGRAQAQVEMTTMLSSTLAMDMDQLRCVADVALDNGAITGHRPLMEVATYVAANKLTAPFVDAGELRKRLAEVSFARLENRIEIRDRTVFVPAMEVRSSAMDIEISGSQTFDGAIDHHLNFRLSELFNSAPVEDEFGPVVDDGTGMRLFLHMTGTTGDPRFATDGAAAAGRRSKAVREQTAELRSILKNELNLFGKREGRTDDAVGNRPAPVITLDGAAPAPRDTTQLQPGVTGTAAAKPPKKGLARLLEKDEDSTRRETVNVLE